MSRRSFVGAMGLGLAAGLTGKAARAAQTGPEIKWRLAASYPKNTDILLGGPKQVAQRVAEATNNRFQIQVFAAGEIVPGLQVLDAVQNGTVECGHSASYYYVGKNPALAFDTTLPFGLNTRQQNAWVNVGGGQALLNDLFKTFNIYPIPCGNTGAQMGGWYRNEIKSLSDLKGLKMRISGIAGQVLAKLGVIPQQLAGGDVYSALEKGSIDAAEWVGPYDDEKLGLYRVAKHYYYPGFWEGSAMTSLYINRKQWDELPPDYRAIVQAACAEANLAMTARFDALNPAALKRLVAAGAKLHAFPRDILEAAEKAAFELYDEIAAANPEFRKIYIPWLAFRRDVQLWFRIGENYFDNFNSTNRVTSKYLS